MIPIIDLKNQYRAIKQIINENVLRVLNSGSYVLGEEVAAFEKDFSFYLKSNFTIGVNSGTDALYLALKGLGLGKGDEVITTPSTFISTAETILRCGAKPVFVDVRESDSNIDPEKVAARMTRKVRAILPVHLYGFVCDMDRLTQISKKGSAHLIEDCAQSVGAYWRGKRVGSFSDAGCFSFYPTKNLGAYGDAGAVVTPHEKLADKIRLLRAHGSSMRGYYEHLGVNSRLDEIQATVLRVKLLYIDRWNAVRRQLAENYDTLLKDAPQVKIFRPQAGSTPVYYLYCILVKNRNTVQEQLLKKGVMSMVHYPVPLHLIDALSDLGYKKGDLPVSESISEQILALPLYPELSFKDQEVVVDALKQALGSVR